MREQSLLFKATQSVGLCYSSPGTLTRCGTQLSRGRAGAERKGWRGRGRGRGGGGAEKARAARTSGRSGAASSPNHHHEPPPEPFEAQGAHFLWGSPPRTPLEIQAPRPLLSSAARELSPLVLVMESNHHRAAAGFSGASPWLTLRGAVREAQRHCVHLRTRQRCARHRLDAGRRPGYGTDGAEYFKSVVVSQFSGQSTAAQRETK